MDVSLPDIRSCTHSCVRHLPRRTQLFLGLLRHLRERHRGHLASGKSWQQSCARTADAACLALSQATQRGQRTTLVATFFLVAAVAGILAVYIARQEFVQVTACLWHGLIPISIEAPMPPAESAQRSSGRAGL